MKFTSFQYLLLFIGILLFHVKSEVCYAISVDEVSIGSYCKFSGNESSEENIQILLIRNNDSWTTSPCEKVENITVSCPASDNSVFRNLSNFNLLQFVHTKKYFSLISHNSLFSAITIHISLLVNILRI